jgi:hypothetical protein
VPDRPTAGWSDRVAVAVVRSDPPEVFLASDADVLTRVLALRVVAQISPTMVSDGELLDIREALLAGEWDRALGGWIAATGEAVDAYPDDEIWTDDRIEAEVASFEIRLAPIFEGYVPDPPALE